LWRVDPARNQICAAAAIRHLEPQVMDLLVLLATSGGRVVSKTEMIDAVWQGRFIAEASLTRTMADLRRALDDEARHPRYIETIPKRGYRLVASVVPENGAEGGSGAHGMEPAPGATGACDRQPTIAAADRAPSVAVLPFTDLGPGEPDRSFSDGLTEEVINVLTRIPQLRVIARTSSFAAAALRGDFPEIGRRLGVTHVLEGSVRRSTGRVRVTAQLIRLSDACHVWSEGYDRPLSDVFAIQDDIAGAIANRLELSLGAQARRANPDIEAYTAHLEARHHFFRGTHDGLEHSRRLLERAIAIDPSYAAAHDALSETYWYMGFYGALVPKEAFSKAVWSTLRALEIDESMAEAHAQLAMLRKELDYNWPEVHRELARAMELDPHSPVVCLRRAIAGLMPEGRLAEAAAEIEVVLETDPLSPFVRWWLATLHFFAGDGVRTVEEADRLIAIEPGYAPAYIIRCGGLLIQGDGESAVRTCERGVELGGGAPWLQGWLGQAYALAGRRDEARAIRERLVGLSASTYVPPSVIAWISLGLGDLDDGFRRMEEAFDVRDPLIIPIRSYPFLIPLRGDPRYQSLLAKMNLA
jgi:TolB-like protein